LVYTWTSTNQAD